MTFGAPQFLYVLALLPALGVFVWWTLARRALAINRIGDPALVRRLSLGAGRRLRSLRLALWLLGVALLIIALARPQWGSDIQLVEQAGVQVMVALDISRSMLAQDLKPSRLDRAKLEISDLSSRLEGDEIGIVLFSGASFIQFPLTSDHATARTYLNNASPNSISRQGTVIAEAIDTAMTGFSAEREHQKIIVIVTDGENHEGDPIAAAMRAAAEGAVIFTVGFGTPRRKSRARLRRTREHRRTTPGRPGTYRHVQDGRNHVATDCRQCWRPLLQGHRTRGNSTTGR